MSPNTYVRNCVFVESIFMLRKMQSYITFYLTFFVLSCPPNFHVIFIIYFYNHISEDEALALYDELFVDTSLEVGKTLSKGERDDKSLNHEKVRLSYIFIFI